MFLYKWVVTKINVFVTNPLIERYIGGGSISVHGPKAILLLLPYQRPFPKEEGVLVILPFQPYYGRRKPKGYILQSSRF